MTEVSVTENEKRILYAIRAEQLACKRTGQPRTVVVKIGRNVPTVVLGTHVIQQQSWASSAELSNGN